jgi:hypothetical protein
LSGMLCVTLLVIALVPVAAMASDQVRGQDQTRDQIQDQIRDQLHDQLQDMTQPGEPADPRWIHLRTRDRLQDGTCQDLLFLLPPIEENEGNAFQHRIQERAQHMWNFNPGLMLAPIWPGTF